MIKFIDNEVLELKTNWLEINWKTYWNQRSGFGTGKELVLRWDGRPSSPWRNIRIREIADKQTSHVAQNWNTYRELSLIRLRLTQLRTGGLISEGGL